MTMIAELPAPIAPLEDFAVRGTEGRMSSLGKAPWGHLKQVRVLGTRRMVDVRAGLYMEESPGLGTYYSADGHTYLCNRQAAWQMAFEEDVDFIHEWAGEHTGAVWSVNYIGAGRV